MLKIMRRIQKFHSMFKKWRRRILKNSRKRGFIAKRYREQLLLQFVFLLLFYGYFARDFPSGKTGQNVGQLDHSQPSQIILSIDSIWRVFVTNCFLIGYPPLQGNKALAHSRGRVYLQCKCRVIARSQSNWECISGVFKDDWVYLQCISTGYHPPCLHP